MEHSQGWELNWAELPQRWESDWMDHPEQPQGEAGGCLW